MFMEHHLCARHSPGTGFTVLRETVTAPRVLSASAERQIDK